MLHLSNISLHLPDRQVCR